MKHLIVISLVVVSMMGGCSKSETYDFREQYTGIWEFVVTYQSESDGEVKETLVNSEGKVYKAENSNQVFIQYSMNDYIIAEVLENGDIYQKNTHSLIGVMTDNQCEIHLSDPENSIDSIEVYGEKS